MLLTYFIGIIGNFTYSTALGWLVLTITNSAGLLAFANAAQNLPLLVRRVLKADAAAGKVYSLPPPTRGGG